jgi:hypothetical protein
MRISASVDERLGLSSLFENKIIERTALFTTFNSIFIKNEGLK